MATYPALVGRVALDRGGLTELPGHAGIRSTCLFRTSDGTAELLWLGEQRDVSCVLTADHCRVVVGSLYAHDGDVINTRLISHPRSVDGAYVAVQISHRDQLPCEFRVQTDKYGFRTVYYVQTPAVFCFSTHISGLRWLLNDALPPLNHDSLFHFYHFGVTPNTETLLSGIRKVPAGSVLVVRGTQSSVTRYFDPLDLYDPGAFAGRASIETITHQIDAAMSASVRRRLTLEGDVALAISGGVDSGFIAKKLKQSAVPLRAYNLAYGAEYDEYDRVKKLEARLGLQVNRMRLQADEVWRTFVDATAQASEPITFNDAALTVLARRARADGASTVWDGDGADRLFLGMRGYQKYARAIRLYAALQRLGLTRSAISALSVTTNAEAQKLATVWRNWLRGIPPYPERQYRPTKAYDAQHEERVYEAGISRFSSDFRQRVPEFDFGLFISYVAIRMCPERFFHTPIEQQYTFNARPVSPYWDDELVRIGLSLPTALKLKGNQTKYVLRRAAALDGDADYWMQSKIGLQSAFDFWTRSAAGAEWQSQARKEIRRSQEFAILKQTGETEPDIDRLIPYWSWKTAHGVHV